MKTPYQYADLDHEAAGVVERGQARIRENDGMGQAYKNSENARLALFARANVDDFKDAVESGDYEWAQKEASDVLNYMLMALSNMERHNE